MANDMLGKRKYLTATCEVRYSKEIPIELRQLVREVYNVKTHPDFIGRGQGTKLIQNICKEADNCKKVLILLPDNEKLEKWYEKFGFEIKQTEPVRLMIRNPHG